MQTELADFLNGWTQDTNNVKPLFLDLYDSLQGMSNVTLEYKGRPGISHSLRAQISDAVKRPLFVLVDIIDDVPSSRWLSVCFYADLITDPEEKGDIVPGGLLGEDARCFDIENDPGSWKAYMLERLQEARANAGTVSA